MSESESRSESAASVPAVACVIIISDRRSRLLRSRAGLLLIRLEVSSCCCLHTNWKVCRPGRWKLEGAARLQVSTEASPSLSQRNNNDCSLSVSIRQQRPSTEGYHYERWEVPSPAAGVLFIQVGKKKLIVATPCPGRPAAGRPITSDHRPLKPKWARQGRASPTNQWAWGRAKGVQQRLGGSLHHAEGCQRPRGVADPMRA
jgi:hypothetical protein